MPKWKQLIFLAKIELKKQIDFFNYFTSSQDHILWFLAQMMKTVSFLFSVNQKPTLSMCIY